MLLFLVPSSAPSNVTAVSNDASSIDVTWGDVLLFDQNGGTIKGYIVFYKEISASKYSSAASLKRNVTIKGLEAATQYEIRVLAYNTNGNGIASERIVTYTSEKGNLCFSM